MLRDAEYSEDADMVHIPWQISDLLSGPSKDKCNVEPFRISERSPERVPATSGLSASACIKTLSGEKPLGQIAAGDHVLTRDNGFQPVRWSGALATGARQQQIVIRVGALAENVPSCDLTLAASQRVLNRAGVLESMFERSEALIRARDLVTLEGFELCDAEDTPAGWQILLDRHELILANDIWTETWQPEAAQVAQMPEVERDVVLSLCPKLSRAGVRRAFPAARQQIRTDLAA